MLPLRDVVLFPHVAMPLLVGRARSLAAVTAAAEGTGELLLVTQRRSDEQHPTAATLHRVGVVARIQQVTRLPNGTTRILVDATERVQIQRFTMPRTRARGDTSRTDTSRPSDQSAAAGVARAASQPILALATPLPLAPAAAAHAETVRLGLRHALSLFEEYASLHRRISSDIVGVLQAIDDPERLAYGIAAHLPVSLEIRQELLTRPSLVALVERLTELLVLELEMQRLERRMDEQVRGAMFQHQREFYLQEQLKAIHRELGHEDGDEMGELEARLAARGLPEAVLTRATREIRRLRKLSPMSPEAAVSRSWLDWIAALPWNERSADTIDVATARDVLDADHHGLRDVKDRILDHVAVLARVGTLRGPILCLVGPPGVGKTSLARSIARALGRPFVRLALGGVRDEAEIRGHRRTYVGALPGRIVQAMRRAEVINPVMLLDELDKLGSDWRGDPAAALLEVLDPEQQAHFADHYLEVDYDLSQVLFLTTANSLSAIPEALRDRLEIVRLPGYLEPEKRAIAERYLLPRQLASHGLAEGDVTIAPDVLTHVIRGWTREAGVRDLERRIARLVRKVARATVERGDLALPIAVTADQLTEWLGVAPYDDDATDLSDRIGVANGLAYTSVGGEVLEVEVSVVPGRGRLQLTGTLGDVMKESASAALTWVRSRLAALGVPLDALQKHDLHVHVPAGATPKDGPSAGIAIASAIASALTGRALRGDVAMTGEVTLRGRVLPIGGVREKGVAAHRQRVRTVLIPAGNARDLTELPDDVRSELTWVTVRTMDEVLTHVLVPAADAAPPTRRRPRATRPTTIAPDASSRYV
ncbi:MAG: endopeptidase La [Gemmatimonadaceae bacterium]|nr:endopeptidase La [Gemmatimonadaceae bacterium]